ncbi:serine hydrolase [Mycolicibacterium murale]|uniref:Serine hydrolase n=1 Tax=Mycolicibacterium murale TaxID=182220 RepID=A0A7I9WJQ3_9MYCO|nr:serine hydrolase domain-containing protein [Mycolicibacterium murale]GFG57982.1 serine hydrolase [Mycolicibacterium murale]
MTVLRCGRVSAAVLSVVLMALPAAPAVAQPPDLRGQLDAAIAAKVQEMGIPGAIVGLSIPGRIDYTTAVGVADIATGVPLSAADHSRIGSVTKTFTGTAVLQLVDQGRIRLTDPIAMYVDGVPNGDRITLDMLGRMRSGLFNYSDDEAFQDRFFAEAPTGPDAFATTPRELVDIAFRHPPNFAPNEKFEYSNTNTVLLGMVVTRVSGQSLPDYLRQNVFAPLGLGQTTWPANGAMPEPFTHGYLGLPDDGGVVDATFWNPSWGDAAGAVISDLADMKVWAAAVGRGWSLRPETQAQRVAGAAAFPGVTYAFAIFDTHGWIGHNGDIPGYTTVSVYLPEQDATLVVFANSDVPAEHSAGQIATAVTSIVTPDHVYNLTG